MAVYMTRVDVSAVSAYPAVTSPSVEIPFVPKLITVVNEHLVPADDAFVSFDGVEDHGHLPGSTAIEYTFVRATKVWLRYGTVGTGPTYIQVIAEG
jgi:hypothetical protein